MTNEIHAAFHFPADPVDPPLFSGCAHSAAHSETVDVAFSHSWQHAPMGSGNTDPFYRNAGGGIVPSILSPALGPALLLPAAVRHALLFRQNEKPSASYRRIAIPFYEFRVYFPVRLPVYGL